MSQRVTQGLTGRALGEAVIDHVLTFPEQHDQSWTAIDAGDVPGCGSTCCIAGRAIGLHYGVQGHDAIYARSYDVGIPSRVVAANLLGVDPLRFADAVFREMDPDDAISNFKHLLDETYSERAS